MTLRDKVAAHFKAHPNTWIDGRAFMRIGGIYGSRSRIADCRTELGMTIENRQSRARAADGSWFTVSEYRFVPADEFRLTA